MLISEKIEESIDPREAFATDESGAEQDDMDLGVEEDEDGEELDEEIDGLEEEEDDLDT